MDPAARACNCGDLAGKPMNSLVDEILAPTIQSGLVISRMASMPSRSSTIVIRPLSGSTKNCPRFDFTTTALRELPTPGSTTTTNTVPAGK